MGTEDTFQRVYQLVKRKIDVRVIAATLNLPLRTILGVVDRIEKSGLAGEKSSASIDIEEQKPVEKPFLDGYFTQKNKYAELQLIGYFTKDMEENIRAELDKIRTSSWKAIAIEFSSVKALDETGIKLLLDFGAEMKNQTRFIALLNPTLEMEKVLEISNIESELPIFGTVSAFETQALSSKNSPTAYKSKNRR